MIEINKLYNENNLQTMSKIVDHMVDGIITSPPYNIATKRKDNYYNTGYSDDLSEEDYLQVRVNEFKEFERVLKDTGVVCYNISYHKENPILPTLLISEIHKQTGMTVADIITWKKSSSMPFQSSATKLSRRCELIYIMVKKEHLHDFTTNKKISKINSKTNQVFYKHYTNLVEARNNDGVISKLKATYSSELVCKLIDIYFPPGSLIYDPFMGIGTTAVGCKMCGRNFIGSELDSESYQIGLDRTTSLVLS